MDLRETWWDVLAGSCEDGNEPSSFMKSAKFLACVSEFKILKKDSDPWS